MSTTNFTGPITTGSQTGVPTTDTRGYVSVIKAVSLSQAAPRQIITIPGGTTLTMLEAIQTSAFTGDDPVSAMSVNFGTSADATKFGAIQVSALVQIRQVVNVSAPTDFDTASGTIVLTLSAVSTTIFTGGGVRAFVHFLTVE